MSRQQTPARSCDKAVAPVVEPGWTTAGSKDVEAVADFGQDNKSPPVIYTYEEPDIILGKATGEKVVGVIEKEVETIDRVAAGPPPEPPPAPPPAPPRSPPGLSGVKKPEEAQEAPLPKKVMLDKERWEELASSSAPPQRTSRVFGDDKPEPGDEDEEDQVFECVPGPGHEDGHPQADLLDAQHRYHAWMQQQYHMGHGPPSGWSPWGPVPPGVPPRPQHPGVPPAPGLGMEAPDPSDLGGPAPPRGQYHGQGNGSHWPHHMYGDHGPHHMYGDPRWAMGPPMPSPWMMMDPHQAYMAGLHAGRNGYMPPPIHDAALSGDAQKTRRRREVAKPATSVPCLQAAALDQTTGDQLRSDLEGPWIELKLRGLEGKEGAEIEKKRAELLERRGKLKPVQRTGEQVIQHFKTTWGDQGALLSLAFDKEGCRLVQCVLECADLVSGSTDTTLKMHRELAPAVRDMAGSPHANYVVTKMIEVAPADSVGLIITHLSDHAEQIARHRYGCRIICRLLQRSYNDWKKDDPRNFPELPGLEGLLREVLQKAQALCCHIFAHHVIQSVLENTLKEVHKHKIFEALYTDLQRCAQDRHASFVIQAALKCCNKEDVKALADGLIGMLPQLATTRFGSYVYNTLCVQENTKDEAIAALRGAQTLLQDSTHGMKLIKQVLVDPEAPALKRTTSPTIEWLDGTTEPTREPKPVTSWASTATGGSSFGSSFNSTK